MLGKDLSMVLPHRFLSNFGATFAAVYSGSGERVLDMTSPTDVQTPPRLSRPATYY